MSTEFDKELDEPLYELIDYKRGENELVDKNIDQAIKAIKQAVDKYVIGEDEPINLRILGVENATYPANRNSLRIEQRQSLWGTK